MSPHELWRSALAVTAIRLPLDPDELDVVCSDSVTCTLTTRGIELDNCIFNSDHLQAILRQAPRSSNSNAVSIRVQVRMNRSLMASIWVMNPQSKERLQVPNIDPVKATLSAYQIKVAYGLQRRTREQGQKITISQAIQRARDSARDLANATTQSARRRALRLMGLSVEEPVVKAKAHLPTTVQPKTSRKRKIDAKHGLAEPIEQASGGSPAGDETPSFPTVVRAPHVATRARP